MVGRRDGGVGQRCATVFLLGTTCISSSDAICADLAKYIQDNDWKQDRMPKQLQQQIRTGAHKALVTDDADRIWCTCMR
jgi:hypothetical protein